MQEQAEREAQKIVQKGWCSFRAIHSPTDILQPENVRRPPRVFHVDQSN